MAAVRSITFLVWGWIGMFNERLVRTALLTPNQHNQHHLSYLARAMVQFLEPFMCFSCNDRTHIKTATSSARLINYIVNTVLFSKTQMQIQNQQETNNFERVCLIKQSIWNSEIVLNKNVVVAFFIMCAMHYFSIVFYIFELNIVHLQRVHEQLNICARFIKLF